MTNDELGLFLIKNGNPKEAHRVLSQLIPQLVAFNSLIFEALNGNHSSEEPATQELIALSQLTSDLYGLKNGLSEYLGKPLK